jgi:hypothetical protein
MFEVDYLQIALKDFKSVLQIFSKLFLLSDYITRFSISNLKRAGQIETWRKIQAQEKGGIPNRINQELYFRIAQIWHEKV